MSTPKSKKLSWFECDTCGVTLFSKDMDKHTNNCPPNVENPQHNYIKNGVLTGDLDVKKNEEIKGLSSNMLDDLVFLSQTAMQLCELSIGDWVIIEMKNVSPIVKKVWPTVEKNSTSVLLTKNVLDLHFGDTKTYPSVCVSKMKFPLKSAKTINLLLVGSSRSLKFNNELNNRLTHTFKGKILTVGNKISMFYFGKILKFIVQSLVCTEDSSSLENNFAALSISEREYFKVLDKTQWRLSRDKQQTTLQSSLSKIGGLSEEIHELQKILHSFNSNSMKSTKSVLLYGNSGTGKTTLANALAKGSGLYVVSISAPDLYSKYSTNPEEAIRDLFEDAIRNSPSIVVLDEVDLLCPLRSSRISETEKRIASTLLVMLDNLHSDSTNQVFIIATTNKIDNIDPAFRRCGRFEREIEILVPNPKSRREILNICLNGTNHRLSEDEIQEISTNTHGFVGADLLSLCSRATLHANQHDRSTLDFSDFKFAMNRVKPSAMREVQIEVPNVKWSDIGGQEKLKLILKQAVEWPLKHSESFIRLGITPPRGVLMFGPPGCSKTMIAKALATESGLNFLSIKGPELFSKWVGESERAVREVFRKARQVAPSIIFFDEIDALGGDRSSGSSTSVQERVLAQLLTELDGVTPLGDVTVLAATNRPDRIDKALLRPGRLDRIVYVPLPDVDTRREIFRLKLRKIPSQNVNIETLVNKTENYSGAEVNAVCHEAAMKALEENIEAQVVNMEHFEMALEMITPRTPRSLISIYEEYVSKII